MNPENFSFLKTPRFCQTPKDNERRCLKSPFWTGDGVINP